MPGKPIVSPELVVAANLLVRGAKDDDDFGSVQMRGIGDEGMETAHEREDHRRAQIRAGQVRTGRGQGRAGAFRRA